ncbi:mannose-1-phosphate guanylyltransferase/mannose-6-phosphate isomerase [Parahalioglobus pacificus]|uniref:mannose-1-phosphate guanylyltransferase n=1 Tax=Parahalioglobus pacificus TaxID=930806 RepID=A0A919CLZ0_9GAMM|nr:mannose-1-phosphate guanylyltransferase/mannose-6-phosphate isomerase [Halioglobus pacificus]NQY01699.1 mannose-1-phosphate guanylyltransferase/mannose-6-phosphate isomerase [Halieaceae bacterium]GHD38531.1 mannose-1-phosphate guanylyltransferase/mannose-6-phosphate isomerase [Halioglobus pacificus]
MLIPVLLSGGVGSRLWPVSREAHPKQFLPLASEASMLQDTLARTQGLDAAAPVVVCNEEHRFMVAEQLREMAVNPDALILEPEGRNTAPAVALAALRALEADAESVLLVLPADHVITDPDAFVAAVAKALPQAQAGRLMTFGVVPTQPETGYGYIKCGEALADDLFDLEQFVEKPDAETAAAYLASGDYLWNSGMFLLNASTYMKELDAQAPAMAEQCRAAMATAVRDMDFVRPDAAAFRACPSDSIDYAVMEKTALGGVVSLDCGWSDVGAWSALWDVGARDDSGNVSKGDVVLEDSTNSYFRSESRLVAAAGVSDLVVVETADAVLVADRDRVQDVKKIVNRLKREERSEASLHHRVFRPWGSYESLIVSERFQVKRIVVNPGQTLSLQMHHHRAEHWIVVAGTAEVTCEDKVFMLGEDESTYIPLGHKHRLANPGRIPLELIEVQSGTYLGEDDIVRFEDVYGRSS